MRKLMRLRSINPDDIFVLLKATIKKDVQILSLIKITKASHWYCFVDVEVVLFQFHNREKVNF